MKKHVLLCNLAGELNIGSLRRLSALHSTFFLLMENISTSSGGSSCCCLHFARSCFPSFFHLIILSLLTAYKGREEETTKGEFEYTSIF